MGIARKLKKKTKEEQHAAAIINMLDTLKATQKREGVLLRALFAYASDDEGKLKYSYAQGMLKQLYGPNILYQLDDEIKKAEKKSKGLDKIVLTGTEAME